MGPTNALRLGTPIGKAWVTLLTNASYLAGCLVLASSLRRHGSRHPLIILVLPLSDPLGYRLPTAARQLLVEAGCQLREVDYLQPEDRGGDGPRTLDARFADTWTKLRALELYEYERVALIDSDMVVRRNLDEVLDDPTLGEGWIAAAHACACNPRKFPHYPADWIPANCGFTYSKAAPLGSSDLSVALQPDPTSYRTLHLLNSGLVVATPCQATFESVLETLNHDPAVGSMTFPDQDLLALHFKHKIKFLGYEYNALKTLRSCHPELWRDQGVKLVHYILSDKPWGVAPADDGEHAVVNGWWREEWNRVKDQLSHHQGFDLAAKCVVETQL